MRKLLNRHKKPVGINQILPLLQHWFAGDTGAALLDKERELVAEALSRCFGYHLLQLSVDASLSLYDDCRVQKKYRLHPFAGNCSVRCDFDELPFANESLDVVVVHHVHEFVSNAHRVLREAQRVVIPHGHLIIIGFNPWSWQGAYSSVAGLMPGSMWTNQLISSRRMKDWLGLLGFDVCKVQYGFHSPQYLEKNASPWLQKKAQHWPLGNFYLMSAVKEVATMTPVKLHWREPGKRFAGLAPVKSQVTSLIGTHPGKEDVA